MWASCSAAESGAGEAARSTSSRVWTRRGLGLLRKNEATSPRSDGGISEMSVQVVVRFELILLIPVRTELLRNELHGDASLGGA
jgi:hypothetical protein